jgi:hypothetical protein
VASIENFFSIQKLTAHENPHAFLALMRLLSILLGRQPALLSGHDPRPRRDQVGRQGCAAPGRAPGLSLRPARFVHDIPKMGRPCIKQRLHQNLNFSFKKVFQLFHGILGQKPVSIDSFDHANVINYGHRVFSFTFNFDNFKMMVAEICNGPLPFSMENLGIFTRVQEAKDPGTPRVSTFMPRPRTHSPLASPSF